VCVCVGGGVYSHSVLLKRMGTRAIFADFYFKPGYTAQKNTSSLWLTDLRSTTF
jgi:hypothetical protein